MSLARQDLATRNELIRVRIEDEGARCADVAREFGLSPSRIAGLVRENNWNVPSRDADAARALADWNRVERASLAARLLAEAHDLLDRLHQPAELWAHHGGEWSRQVVDRPQPADAPRLMTAAAIAIDKVAVLTDGDEPVAVVPQLTPEEAKARVMALVAEVQGRLAAENGERVIATAG